MFERSSLKRLLVHEGTGMGLDHLRREAIEIGVISRERHNLALKQLQSTGLDKFVTVLATTPEGGEWSVASRIGQCLAFLERSPGQVAFISGEGRDLETAQDEGAVVFEACWAAREATGFPAIYEPGEVAATVMRAWR
jgi:phosphoglycolate phosphatase-like HAD superfamily hydrolase